MTYLASRSCQSSHENYSACAGRYARAFVGLGEGWLADTDADATADDIAEHFAEVSDTEPFTVPANIYEELFDVVELPWASTYQEAMPRRVSRRFPPKPRPARKLSRRGWGAGCHAGVRPRWCRRRDRITWNSAGRPRMMNVGLVLMIDYFLAGTWGTIGRF